MKVLVTAFKPFNKSINNYSMEVLSHLTHVDKLIIDVNYDDCYMEIISKYDLNKYDLIIAMGEARMRDELTLELQAKNISSCSISDNKGNLKQKEVIVQGAPETLETNVQIEELGIKISVDAGKFVCNNIYYHLLSDYPNKGIFIHIPHCHDDEIKYMEYARMIEGIISKISSL